MWVNRIILNNRIKRRISYHKNNKNIFVDGRETAPLAATKNMYLDENGDFTSNKSKVGALAVGVPGTIAGIFAVHKKLGSLPIEQIIAPVIALAINGYLVTEQQAKRITYFKESFQKSGAGALTCCVDESYVKKLLGYFKNR